MSVLRAKGNGLFIESFRTPAEHKRAQKDKQLEEALKENKELKERMKIIEEKLGVTETKSTKRSKS